VTGGRDDTTTTASVKALLTSGVVTACFYAHRPQDRPCCDGLGVVRYGPTTLCADCDRRRSAVGVRHICRLRWSGHGRLSVQALPDLFPTAACLVAA
jgi:hypothetical protein